TENTIAGATELDRELAKVWRQGYATAIEEIEIGYSAVGAPIRDLEGHTVAAISVGGASARFTKARIGELVVRLREAADLISRRLGAAPVSHAPSANGAPSRAQPRSSVGSKRKRASGSI